MIHVDRKSIPKPEFWDSPQFQDFLKEWARFHGEEGGSRGTQRRMPYGSELDNFKQQALWPLLQAFHGKCAYTEQKISEKDGVVVFHRPEADAMDNKSEGSPDPGHYWWAVCDWTNWYPASRQVLNAKGTVFPVAGERSPLPDTGGVPSQSWLDKNRDRGLLLDPGRDHPAWHLDFRPDGTVRPRLHPSPKAQAWAGGQSRGETTIRLLDLNRRELVERREHSLKLFSNFQKGNWDESYPNREFATAFGQQLAKTFLGSQPISASQLSSMVELFAEEFAAEIAQAHLHSVGLPSQSPEAGLANWQPVQRVLAREWPELGDETLAQIIPGGMFRSLSASVEPKPRTKPAAPDPAASLGVTRGAPAPSAPPQQSQPIIERSARVESVEIHNFKAIKDLKVDLRTDGIEITPRYGFTSDSIQTAVNWTAFLGENGSGKSCCLQAIGLALAGDELGQLVADSKLEWRKLLRQDETSGSISLGFTGGSSIKLNFTADGFSWQGEAPKMAGFVRGYGATRLLEAGASFEEKSDNVRLDNLFNPRAEVLDAQKWLLDLAASNLGDFNTAALTLAGFLGGEAPPLDEPATNPDTPRFIQPNGDRTEILVGGDPLSYASDGYRAVVALVCDIMAGIGKDLTDMRNATGIVLIDELGAHLHPRWKMEITNRLRREFSRIQFFVSTHEPLSLRGLREKEVFRVRKKRPEGAEKSGFTGRVEIEVIERSPSAYRVDQLLTSEFFGLDTTIDPDLDRRFQAYYRLLAMTETDRKARTLAHDPARTLQQEFESLQEQVRNLSRPVLGFTRRDQLIFEALDEFMVGTEETPELRRERRQKTLKKIRDIWKPPDFLKDLESGS